MTVAMTAPAMPQWNTITNSRSSPIFRIDAMTMAYSGVLLSPSARRMLASTLYAMMMGIPANMMRRYVNAPPMISSGVFMARSTGAMATWLRMTVKIEMTAESEIVAPMERLRPSWSSAPKRCAM